MQRLAAGVPSRAPGNLQAGYESRGGEWRCALQAEVRKSDKREGYVLTCSASQKKQNKKPCRVFGDSYSQLCLVAVVRYYEQCKKRDVPDLLKRRGWIPWVTGVKTDLSVCREADEIIGREEGAKNRACVARLVTEAVLVWLRERAEQRAGNRARTERSAGPVATQASQPFRAGGL